jgi:hypothetical protein
MKAKLNSRNCEMHMNKIRVAGDLRNDFLTRLIAILGSNTRWGRDVCLNYYIFLLSSVDRVKLRLAITFFHGVVTNTLIYKSNKTLYHLQKLLKICETNHGNLTKKETRKDVQPQFCLTMVAVLLLDSCKIWNNIQADKKRNENNGKNHCDLTMLYEIKLFERNCKY